MQPKVRTAKDAIAGKALPPSAEVAPEEPILVAVVNAKGRLR